MLEISCDESKSAGSILSQQIESVRTHMINLGGQYGLDHPEVQRCSELLDMLLLQYYSFMSAEKR